MLPLSTGSPDPPGVGRCPYLPCPNLREKGRVPANPVTHSHRPCSSPGRQLGAWPGSGGRRHTHKTPAGLGTRPPSALFPWYRLWIKALGGGAGRRGRQEPPPLDLGSGRRPLSLLVSSFYCSRGQRVCRGRPKAGEGLWLLGGGGVHAQVAEEVALLRELAPAELALVGLLP